jgi:hypothetical protein
MIVITVLDRGQERQERCAIPPRLLALFWPLSKMNIKQNHFFKNLWIPKNRFRSQRLKLKLVEFYLFCATVLDFWSLAGAEHLNRAGSLLSEICLQCAVRALPHLSTPSPQALPLSLFPSPLSPCLRALHPSPLSTRPPFVYEWKVHCEWILGRSGSAWLYRC